MLLRQLLQVAQEARRDDYRMGERYDMDHIYYIDGHNWHGSAHYYEYPCVFTWVLAHEYLGLKFALGVDLLVAPCIQGLGQRGISRGCLHLYRGVIHPDQSVG